MAGAQKNAFSFTWRKEAPKPLSREMTPEHFEDLFVSPRAATKVSRETTEERGNSRGGSPRGKIIPNIGAIDIV